MRTASKIAAPTALVGMVILPNIWLIWDPPLLILFWLLGLPILVVFPMHYCRRCRHFGCPLNKAVDPDDALH